MIELIPAIDIIGGKCVRLTKGDYSTKKEYGDPVSMAREFEQLGFKRLHVVDLDGAKSKHVVNDATLKAITQATKLTVDFGGGVKTEDDLGEGFTIDKERDERANQDTGDEFAESRHKRPEWFL